MRGVPIFAIATLTPLPLLVAGAIWGGVWALAGLTYMTVFTFALDALVRLTPAGEQGQEFPAAQGLSVVLALAHFAALPLAIWALSLNPAIGWSERLELFLGFGMFFGQVSNSNAHELIHSTDKRLFGLGMWTYVTLLFGHHTSAHRLVHHRLVGSDADPNSARLEEGFYRFARRAWVGSFRDGWAAETKLRQGNGLHPYAIYCGGAVAGVLLCLYLAGWPGLVVYLMLSAYAQMQLLLSDYVQHYGLARTRLADGKLEPVGAHLSWNAPQWFSAHLMLNAPRHSDHHNHPSRAFPALRLSPDDPTLPASLPVMAMLALFPRRWRRVMSPRARDAVNR